jgi:hypothetical protein
MMRSLYSPVQWRAKRDLTHLAFPFGFPHLAFLHLAFLTHLAFTNASASLSAYFGLLYRPRFLNLG